MRQRLCKVCGGWHELENWPRECVREAPPARSHLAAPMIIRDDLGPNGLLNHADNRIYTSKSAYLNAVKANGCEVIGSDTLPPRRAVPMPKDPTLRQELSQRLNTYKDTSRIKKRASRGR